MSTQKIKVDEIEITIVQQNDKDYISLTDMVKKTQGDQLIKNWLKNKNTIEYLGAWESVNNPKFNMVDFYHIRSEAGTNRFLLSVNQWVEKTGAIGLFSRAGRFGGTYAHRDIAFEFGMWISPHFKLVLIKEYQALKEQEAKLKNSEWDYRRFLCKVNYRVQTDAIKENIIPKYQLIKKEDEAFIYANEAEIINIANFGKTSKQWREENPKDVLKGLNMRDFATIPQLTVLSNLESINSHLIKEGLPPKERLEKLKAIAVSQLKSLSKYEYSFPIESPHSHQQNSTFDNALKGLLTVPPPKKD